MGTHSRRIFIVMRWLSNFWCCANWLIFIFRCRWSNGAMHLNVELQTFRTQDLSFSRTKGPYGEPGTFVPGTFRSRELSFSGYESSLELSFPGPFVLGNFLSRGTKVPRNLGPFIPGNFRSLYPIGLVAALLCVLNYCMFGCDFTLMMLTPLWTSQLTLYVM